MGIFKKKRDCIFSSASPLAGLTAEVIEENDCSYLYLRKNEISNGKPSFKMVSTCWIKNHVTVADAYSPKHDMSRGLQPKTHTRHCGFEHDMGILEAGQLEIVWGKEGLAVSLYENGELICVIPAWADGRKFMGYSKYSCTSEYPSMIPFPLGNPQSNVLFQRMSEARTFWNQDFGLLWDSYKESYLAELEQKYGKHTKYYAIDGGVFPPKALATFEKGGMKYAFTIGVGNFPQPKVDMYFEAYQNHELIELGFCYRSNTDLEEQNVFSQISSIAAIPWAFQTFLGHRHTVDLKVSSEYNNAVLISDKSVHVHKSHFLENQTINLLWIMPVTNDVYMKLIAEPADYSDVETKITTDGIVCKF